MRIYFLLILGLILTSCNEDSKLESEIAKINVDFTLERFDNAELEAAPNELKNLKLGYPFLFSGKTPDSVWVNRLQDTLQNEILKEVQTVLPDLKEVKLGLENMFKHIKYYDKTFSVPKVVTLTNFVDYRNSIIVNDTLVLVALDNYLGEDHKFYQNIPKYLAANLRENQIVPDVAENFAEQYIFPTKRKTFLEEMIFFGKVLYFKDLMIPFVSDANKIGYTNEEIEWAQANESPIWSYFVEKELLYSTDPKLPNRFIADAPFSKFYLELDNQSPGKLGQYIGWQIVKAYANNTDVRPIDVLQKSPEEIFRKSKFKPKK